MEEQSKKSKIISFIIKLVFNIPKLRNKIYQFYAWKIFKFVPLLKNFIYIVYDKLWYFELLAQQKDLDLSKHQKNSYEIDIERLQFTINPTRISLKKILESSETWDLPKNLVRLEETNEYKLIQTHFLKNVDWQDIEQYNYFIKTNIDADQSNVSVDKFQFEKLLESFDTFYHNLNKSIIEKFNKEIKVVIGRFGNYIVVKGIFYVILLKLLQIPSIEIEILKRHSEWINFSTEFLNFQFIHGGIYQPLIHPDLNIESLYSDTRFEIIKQNLTFKKGTILDIGANLGYFCHKFEDLGFNCYAVEIRPSNVYFMKKLRDIESKHFNIINKSIFDLDLKIEIDIVLALNIFHHFLREKQLYLKLIDFLNQLKMKVMYFQPHDPDEEIMKNAYKNYNNQQFVNFIIKNSCLNHFEILNEKVEGKNRPIYKLSI
ncbi:MAG: class I SAM-dependent methyltransferase [Promethearchaeota archaeon]